MKKPNFWQKKKVLITGGAGFIGSHLTEYLQDRGALVSIADDLSRGSMKNLEEVGFKGRCYKGDCGDKKFMWFVSQDKDIVLNLAAKVTGIEYNRLNQAEMMSANMKLQLVPLEVSAKNHVKRFLQVSTACVYPHDAPIPTPEDCELGEPEPTNSGYGWAKRMGEAFAQFYMKDMEVAIARPSNGAGTRDYFDEETSHVIPALGRRFLRGDKRVVIWGSGNQRRSFINARDFAKGLALVAEHGVGEVVNIGHAEEVSMWELARMIRDELGSNHELAIDPSKPDGYARRLSSQKKLVRLTGWWPAIPIKDTVRDVIECGQKKSFSKETDKVSWPKLKRL